MSRNSKIFLREFSPQTNLDHLQKLGTPMINNNDAHNGRINFVVSMNHHFMLKTRNSKKKKKISCLTFTPARMISLEQVIFNLLSDSTLIQTKLIYIITLTTHCFDTKIYLTI